MGAGLLVNMWPVGLGHYFPKGDRYSARAGPPLAPGVLFPSYLGDCVFPQETALALHHQEGPWFEKESDGMATSGRSYGGEDD